MEQERLRMLSEMQDKINKKQDIEERKQNRYDIEKIGLCEYRRREQGRRTRHTKRHGPGTQQTVIWNDKEQEQKKEENSDRHGKMAECNHVKQKEEIHRTRKERTERKTE
jgi:hypothetical protein